MLKKSLLVWLALLLLLAGTITSTVFLFGAKNDRFWISGAPYDYATTGQVGDFIGGVAGTLFALAGTLLIYLSFREQTKQTKREAFESSFFEMMRLHRENVSELTYTKQEGNQKSKGEGRKVFKSIIHEFIECYREVKKVSTSVNPDDYLLPSYKLKLQNIVNSVNPKISIVKLAIIDIAYCILFFGVNKEGEATLKHRFKTRYQPDYYFRIIPYIKLKPKAENKTAFELWEKLWAQNPIELKKIIEELYLHRTYISQPKNLSPLANSIWSNNALDKYYGGHQYRISHYFRHLFQCYKYINNDRILTWNQKYFYGKTLRAQLSTYEQAIIFINSLSSLGFKWEFTPELNKDRKKLNSHKLAFELNKRKLITNFHLIKNLHGQHIIGIKYRLYYPNVKYEAEE